MPYVLALGFFCSSGKCFINFYWCPVKTSQSASPVGMTYYSVGARPYVFSFSYYNFALVGGA